MDREISAAFKNYFLVCSIFWGDNISISPRYSSPEAFSPWNLHFELLCEQFKQDFYTLSWSVQL